MRTLRALQDKRTDVLWNDAQHRRLQSAFHIVNRLHAGVEILNEKCETDSHNQSHDDSQGNVQFEARADRFPTWLSLVGDFHNGSFWQRRVHGFLQNPQMHRVAKLCQIVQPAFCFEIGPVLFRHECVVRPGVVNRACQAVQMQPEGIDLQLQSRQHAFNPLVDVRIQVRLHCGHSLEI